MNSISALPKEMLMECLSPLNVFDSALCRRVSHSFQAAILGVNRMEGDGLPLFFPVNVEHSQTADEEFNGQVKRVAETADRRLRFGEAKKQKLSECNSEARYFSLLEMNDRVIGLYALLQQVPGFTIPLQLPSPQVYTELQNWVTQKGASLSTIRELQIIQFKGQSPFASRSKIFNCLPSEIHFFTRLTSLVLRNNLLNELPESLLQVPLQKLDISCNHFREIPEILTALTELTELNISSQLSGPIQFDNLARLSHLLHLDLSNNGLRTVPKLPPQIKTLILDENPIEEVPL